MSKCRRMLITQDEGELIKVSLVCAIDEVSRIRQKEDTPYWKIMQMKMEDLLQKLRDYKWTIE